MQYPEIEHNLWRPYEYITVTQKLEQNAENAASSTMWGRSNARQPKVSLRAMSYHTVQQNPHLVKKKILHVWNLMRSGFLKLNLCTSAQWPLVWVCVRVRTERGRDGIKTRELVGVFYRILANMMFYVSIKSSKAMLTFHGLETLSVLCENGCIVWNRNEVRHRKLLPTRSLSELKAQGALVM